MMQENESIERLVECLTKAASRSREMGAMTGVRAWKDLSQQFITMRKKALAMYRAKGLNDVQVAALCDRIQVAQAVARGMQRQ